MLFYTLDVQYYKTMGKRKEDDDIFLSNKTEEKRNSVTPMKSRGEIV